MSDELPEIRETPDGWTTTSVREIVDRLQYGISTKADANAGTGIPILRMGNIQEGRLDISDLKFVPRSKALDDVLVARGDILFNRTNSPELVGKSAVIDTDDQMVFASYLIRLRAKLGVVDPQYLCWWINSAWGREWADRVKTDGVSQSNINGTKLGEMPVPLAPANEQQRIVEAVEGLLEQVNQAKTRLDRVPLILKRFRQAVLAAACSGRLTEEWREENDLPPVVAPPSEVGDDEQENSDTFQSDLPSTWSWVALDDACEDVIDYRGRTPPTAEGGRIPHVRTTNVRRGKIDWNTESFVTEAVYGEYMTRGIPRVGDVVFTMEAPMGDAGVVDTDRKFSLAQRLLLLRGKSTMLNGAFLAHILQASPVRRAIEHRATGTTVLGIAYKRFKYVRLPIPPMPEQKAIVDRVDELFALSDAVERRVQTASARADKLPQAILSKAFSGELVPTEADLARVAGRTYETAAELLARIERKKQEGVETSGGRRAPKSGRASKRRAG